MTDASRHDAARVALVANAIDNKGAIDVPMGHVALAAETW